MTTTALHVGDGGNELTGRLGLLADAAQVLGGGLYPPTLLWEGDQA